MKRQNTQPKYILGDFPDKAILGTIGINEIQTNGIAYTEDFVTEFAKILARYFKDNPDKVQDKGESA